MLLETEINFFIRFCRINLSLALPRLFTYISNGNFLLTIQGPFDHKSLLYIVRPVIHNQYKDFFKKNVLSKYKLLNDAHR